MQVLCHHIYEYQKGLRHLVLHTMKSSDRDAAENKLNRYDVDYIITKLSNGNINIFFGKRECVEVVRSFGNIPLNKLSVEQDFILGIMLGYDRLAQCSRFLKRNGYKTVTNSAESVESSKDNKLNECDDSENSVNNRASNCSCENRCLDSLPLKKAE